MDAPTWPNLELSLEKVPPDLRDRLAAELAPGELLQWAAAADPEHLVMPGLYGQDHALEILLPLLAAALVTGGNLLLVFGLCADAGQIGGSSIFFGICLIFCGLHVGLLAIGELSRDWNRSHVLPADSPKNLYALTDRRAIFWEVHSSKNLRREICSLRPGEFHRIYRVEQPDGLGDLIFQIFPGRDGEAWDTFSTGLCQF